MESNLLQQKKRKLVELLLERNILVEPEFLDQLSKEQDSAKLAELFNQKLTNKPQKEKGTVKILFSYVANPKKIVVQDFINYFTSRYNAIKRILQQRSQLENVTSISRLRGKNEREVVSIIGMVSSKEDTKNGLMLTIEDPTGAIKVFSSKNKQPIFTEAKNIVDDEVIGVSGTLGKNIIFANEFYFPDIPLNKEMKKSPVEEYAAFISDTHIGSKHFLEDEFMKFIRWIRGEEGDERSREIASKVKYLFVTGDLIDGVAIYPGQKDEVLLKTYREQYKKAAELLRLIPGNILILICPGQHDIVPIAEPQIPLPQEYCQELFEMPNVIPISNPSLVNIGSRDGFPGFDVLVYHGGSYHHYAHNVESIRLQKANLSERSEYVMKFLLQKRHLAPTYDGNPHMPTESDHLVIDKVPDIFISGDVHKSAVFNYKGIVTGIVSSCFQAKTAFQEKVGHDPDIAKVPIFNLQTREVKILSFSNP